MLLPEEKLPDEERLLEPLLLYERVLLPLLERTELLSLLDELLELRV